MRKYNNCNVAGFKPAPFGNRPSGLTTKLYVVINLRRNSYAYNCSVFNINCNKRAL